MAQLLRQLTTDNPKQKLNFQKYLPGNTTFWWMGWTLQPLQNGLKTFQYKVVPAKSCSTTKRVISWKFVLLFFLVSIVLRNSQIGCNPNEYTLISKYTFDTWININAYDNVYIIRHPYFCPNNLICINI